MAYTLRFWWGAFATAAKYIYVDPEGAEENVRPRRPVPWGFAAAPVLLAALSLVGGLRRTLADRGLQRLRRPVRGRARRATASPCGTGSPSRCCSRCWRWQAGCCCSGSGTLIAKAQSTFPNVLEAEEAYQRTMRAVDRLAVEVTAVTQRGSLPLYLGSILLVVIVLPGGALLVLRDWPNEVRLYDTPAQLLIGVIMVGGRLPGRHVARPAARR